MPVGVDRAERRGEAAAEVAAAVRAAAQHDQLVGHGAEARLVGVHRRLRVMELLEAHDLAVLADLGEQLAAFRDLLDELVPADGLPLALAALAGALERHGDAVGLGVAVQRAVAAAAHGAAQLVALAVGVAQGLVRLGEGRLEVQERVQSCQKNGVNGKL